MNQSNIEFSDISKELSLRLAIAIAWLANGERYFIELTNSLVSDLNFYIALALQTGIISACLLTLSLKLKKKIPILQDFIIIYSIDAAIQIIGFILWWFGFDSRIWSIANSSIGVIKMCRICWPDHGFITALSHLKPWRLAIKMPMGILTLCSICFIYVTWHGYSPTSQSERAEMRALIAMIIFASFTCLMGNIIINRIVKIAQDRLSALTQLTAMKAGNSDISRTCQRILDKLQTATAEQVILVEHYAQVVCNSPRPAANEANFDRAMCYAIGKDGNHIIMCTPYNNESALNNSN
ncbi:hypothetical protein V8J88_05450 [Massilia sp. W12]|uniref:hypothetical protein n=1 Tax=Massilia sp. W12 TaxID=3126507 RepID=UPI0030CE6B8E